MRLPPNPFDQGRVKLVSGPVQIKERTRGPRHQKRSPEMGGRIKQKVNKRVL